MGFIGVEQKGFYDTTSHFWRALGVYHLRVNSVFVLFSISQGHGLWPWIFWTFLLGRLIIRLCSHLHDGLCLPGSVRLALLQHCISALSKPDLSSLCDAGQPKLPLEPVPVFRQEKQLLIAKAIWYPALGLPWYVCLEYLCGRQSCQDHFWGEPYIEDDAVKVLSGCLEQRLWTSPLPKWLSHGLAPGHVLLVLARASPLRQGEELKINAFISLYALA